MLIKDAMYSDLITARIVVEGPLLDRFYSSPYQIDNAPRQLNMLTIAESLVGVDMFVQDCRNGRARTYLAKTIEMGLRGCVEYPIIEVVAEKTLNMDSWENLITQVAARIVNTLSASLESRMAVVYLEDKSFCVADGPEHDDSLVVIGA